MAAIIALALVVLLVVVAAIVSANRTPLHTAAGSPEATVQLYFDSLLDERPQAVLNTFTDDLRIRCTDTLYRRWSDQAPSRVNLDAAIVEGAIARVAVRIATAETGGLLDSNSATFDETIVLDHGSGAWLISVPPWPFTTCDVKVPS